MMPNPAMEDFKKNGPFSEIFRRLAVLEKQQRDIQSSCTLHAYTPVITGSGGGTAPTYTGVCTGKYVIVGGRLVVLSVDLVNTLGGVAGAGANAILVSSPTAIGQSIGVGAGVVYENGGTAAGIFVRIADANHFCFQNYALTDITCNDQSSVNRYLRFTTTYFL